MEWVGSTVTGIPVGLSAGSSLGGGSLVRVVARLSVGMGSGVSVDKPVSVPVGIAVFVGSAVFITGISAEVVIPLTDGLVPQSTCALMQFVTSACKAAGSQALKKSWWAV